MINYIDYLINQYIDYISNHYTDYVGTISAFIIALLLSNVVQEKQARILAILGWLIALFFSKGVLIDE